MYFSHNYGFHKSNKCNETIIFFACLDTFIIWSVQGCGKTNASNVCRNIFFVHLVYGENSVRISLTSVIYYFYTCCQQRMFIVEWQSLRCVERKVKWFPLFFVQ